MMNVRGIQRNMKNVVKNYSDAQVKVREATSNDHWGPSSTLMSEIADLTYNVVAFSEIMQMIWKRLNDHGKNWRHVYKALVLLEYLIKTGSEKVAQQCKENIFAIQTLKDFQYIEENKDQGMNVREKSKALVALLKDDDKLRNERTRALKAKERFAQSVSYASDSQSSETVPKSSISMHESLGAGDAVLATELERARPQTLGEEELQLQLALAMSKEECEQEEKLRRNDDIRLQLAISESQKRAAAPAASAKKSAVDDLLSLTTGMDASGVVSDPWACLSSNGSSLGAVGGAAAAPFPGLSADPWSTSSAAEPAPTPAADPWSSSPATRVTSDPWQPSPPPGATSRSPNPMSDSDAWLSVESRTVSGATPSFGSSSRSPDTSSQTAIRKTPESFLGPNSNLVNLDALVSTKSTGTGLATGGNPFAGSSISGMTANPFQAAKPAAPTINQLRSQGSFPVSGAGAAGPGFAATGSGFQPMAFPSPDLQPAGAGSSFSIPSGNNPFSM